MSVKVNISLKQKKVKLPTGTKLLIRKACIATLKFEGLDEENFEVDVSIVNDEIDATKPIINFIIKGLSSVDVPALVYNGVTYQLTSKGNNTYESERLNLVDTATKVTICINDTPLITFGIKVSTGATEENLFEGF